MQRTVILTKDGEPEGVARIDQDQLSKLRSKTFQSGSSKIGVVDTGVVSEELNQSDYKNIAVQLGRITIETLRQHGDEVAFASAREISPKGVTIHVKYKADELGDSWEDDFRYEIKGNHIYIPGEQEPAIQLTQQSGQVKLQSDLLKDKLMQFIEKQQVPETENVEECNQQKNLILGFKQALEEYREDKKKIKNVFVSVQGFDGNTTSEKLKNAMSLCEPRSSVESIPSSVAVESEDADTEVKSGESSICMTMSLLLRLFEHVREDIQDDVELHHVAERLEGLAQKGTLMMKDFDEIVDFKKKESAPGRSEGTDIQTVDEISSSMLDRAAYAADNQGRDTQASAFEKGANERRKEELGANMYNEKCVDATRKYCKIEDPTVGRWTKVTGEGDITCGYTGEKSEDIISDEYGNVSTNLYKFAGDSKKKLGRIMAKWCERYLNMDVIGEEELRNKYIDWHFWVEL